MGGLRDGVPDGVRIDGCRRGPGQSGQKRNASVDRPPHWFQQFKGSQKRSVFNPNR
jgi:hypothetical protein